jgi:ABC-type transport system involved in multi-copper enzyme maturation permease subunit
MNVFVKKEIRLLLPVWLAVLVLEAALPWIGTEPGEAIAMAPVFFFFGMILLAVDSFGREFSLGTFSSLMSQPMERRQIWRTKITVLLIGATLIFAAYFASCELRLLLAIADRAITMRAVGVKFFAYVMTASAAGLFVALAGGLWTTLLLRQISAAFWITFLVPVAILLAGIFFLPEKFSGNERAVDLLLYGLAAAYAVAGFWLAHRLFHRAQDAAWTGGVISFSTWRYFSAGKQTTFSMRRRRPLAALLKKEFQLHSISLFCIGSLVVLHLAAFILRITYVQSHESSVAAGFSDLIWTVWLVMPLIIGGTAVAEERKLGLAESQFCLPVSRRTQFAVKFIPVMIFGTLVGGVMPMLLETLADRLGAPCANFRPQNNAANLLAFELIIVSLAAGLSWVSFFASTLARNFLQALSISIVTIVGCCMLVTFISDYADVHSEHHFSLLGILPWPSALPVLIGVPALLIMLVWLVYRNFNWFSESWRLWRGNLQLMIGTLLLVFVSSALVYNRVWEVFEPAEPAHGPAKFSLPNPSVLRGDFYRSLLVRLPDGRVWFDNLGYPFVPLLENHPSPWWRIWLMITDPRPVSIGPRQFVAGFNWVSVTAARRDYWVPTPQPSLSYLDTVGVKADGTLWVSSRSEPKAWTGGEMTQFGTETNWQQVARYFDDRFLLLKNDGTLWWWGTNRVDYRQSPDHRPSVRNFQPRQFGTNADWREIGNAGSVFARKTDGSTWSVGMDNKTGQERQHELTNYDRFNLKTFSSSGEHGKAFIGNDGTLWIQVMHKVENYDGWEGKGYTRVGQDTNWVAVAYVWPLLTALKADGSLWRWESVDNFTGKFADTPPTRLGIHSDWIGLIRVWDGAVSLAADGSLWFWPGADHADLTLFKYPKQPKRLGNVFGPAD